MNILFITADQWRGECLSALGHPVVNTPTLDALAVEGVMFTRHFANTAPCGPSRTTMHTGLYLQNHRSGTNGTPLDARHDNWAKQAAKAGYDPVLFGYTDISQDPRGRPLDDPWRYTYEGPLPGIRVIAPMGENPTEWVAWMAERGVELPDAPGAYGHRLPGAETEDGAPFPRPNSYPAELDDTAYLTGRLMDWLPTATGPFVAHLSLLRPHPPFVATEPWNRLYDPAAMPGFTRAADPESEGKQHPWLAYQLSRKAWRATDNEARLKRLKAVYFALMSRVDHELGKLFARMKELGLWDNTLVIFTSDHGEQMGDHWLMGKGGYFDQSYHVPMIIRDPRAAADSTRGTRIDRFTEHVDVAPTMLAAIGAAPLEGDGYDLGPYIAGSPPERWRGEAHWEFDFRSVPDDAAEQRLDVTLEECTLNVIRSEEWKYVHFTTLPPLLFDLRADPGETTNLAEDPAHFATALRFAQKMLSWRMAHDEKALGRLAITSEGVVERA